MRINSFRSSIRNQIRINPFSVFFWILLSRLEKKKRKYKLSQKLLDNACSYFFFRSDEILIETTRFLDFDKKKGICLMALKTNPFLEKIWCRFLFYEKNFTLKKKILKSFVFFSPINCLVWRIVNIITGMEFAYLEKEVLWIFFRKNLWTKVNFHLSKNEFIYQRLKKIKKNFTRSLKTDFFSWIIEHISFDPNFGSEICNAENFSNLKSKFYLYYSLSLNPDFLISFSRIFYPIGFKNDKVKEEQDIYCRLMTLKMENLPNEIFYFRLGESQELLHGKSKKWLILLKVFEKTIPKLVEKTFLVVFFIFQPFGGFLNFFLFWSMSDLRIEYENYPFFINLFNSYYLEIEKIRLMILFFKKKNWTLICFRLSLGKRGMVEKNAEIFPQKIVKV
mmetsp:Transcript_117868/g.176081  ORF Transcript_117868/g.176081 Transcript_117868/m.176081 type:complete len:392 (+) Transcript_117868:128-1303(+)